MARKGKRYNASKITIITYGDRIFKFDFKIIQNVSQ